MMKTMKRMMIVAILFAGMSFMAPTQQSAEAQYYYRGGGYGYNRGFNRGPSFYGGGYNRGFNYYRGYYGGRSFYGNRGWNRGGVYLGGRNFGVIIR